MKNTLKLMFLVLLAFGMFACGEKKLTQEDLKAAEATLFNEDQSMNMEVASGVADKYCQFVKESPDDPTAPMWLFHAFEINVRLMDTEKCETLCNQLVDKYPESKWSPRALLLLGSYVYNDYLQDTAQAHVAFQRIIDEYPDSELVDDAQKSIEYLGLSPDEILTRIMVSQMVEEEEVEE